MSKKPTSPETLYGTGRDYLREQIKTNEILADIAGVEYTPPEGVPKGKYMENKWLLDAAEKKNELLEEIAEGGPGGGSAAAKAIGIDYATDGIFLKNKNGDTIQGSGATLPAYGVTFDPATGGLTLTKNGTAVQGQTVTIPNYGSPVGVDASADMTDHDKIYLYLGTTGGGLTNGHFYYWDGSAWADGGEYAAATVQTDKTLLVEDRAADAKATGDAVNSLKTQLNQRGIPTGGSTGQSLRKKSGTNYDMEWADVGLPTDEQTADAVSAWLDEHPEATTTVEDHSLTYEKLVNGTLGFVMPEMYGAIGDGIEDDTNAIQNCIANNSIILLKKTYKITRALNFSSKKNIIITGGGTITREIDKTFNTIDGDKCENITIDSIILDGNGNNRALTYTWRDNNQAAIILAGESKQITINNCVIKNFNYGVYIIGASANTTPSFNNTAANGLITNCRFYNCHYGIDTYGKNIVIDNNLFYDITQDAIQIEPVGSIDFETENPLEDSNYFASAYCVTISNNYLVNIAECGIYLHENCNSVIIENNTIINFKYGIVVKNYNSRAITIKTNSLFNQRLETVNADKRPWAYAAAIAARGNTTNILNNMLFNCNVAIYTASGTNIDGNTIDSPRISAIVEVYDAGNVMIEFPTKISNNIIKNFICNTSAWWDSKPIVLNATRKTIIINNYIETDSEPVAMVDTAKAYVVNLVSTTQQNTTIPTIDGIFTYATA